MPSKELIKIWQRSHEILEDLKKRAIEIQELRLLDRCPECNGRMIRKHGKKGDFFGCANYPHCFGKYTYSAAELELVELLVDMQKKKGNEPGERTIEL